MIDISVKDLVKSFDEDENLLDRAELLARLHHLPEMEKASLRNIL